jgi:lipoprotein-releasing system ATP-binding protein
MRVSARDLGMRFGDGPWLFTNLSFNLTGGDLVALVGPSGSGKSTLLSVLAREKPPAAGEVTHDQVASVGWVFQNPYGVRRRLAVDHVALPFLAAGLSRRQAEARALRLLEDFRLAAVAGRDYAQLSGGEAQRLQLARAIAAQPSLLLVDEPTAQLDAVTAATVNEVLDQLAREGTAVVVATHDKRTAERCERVIDLASHVPAGV